MKSCLYLAMFFLSVIRSPAQQTVDGYSYEPCSVRIGEGRTSVLPCSEKGFTLMIPADSVGVKGTIIALEDYRLDSKDSLKYQLIQNEAVSKGFAFLIVMTGVPVDLFFSESSLVYADTLMKTIFTTWSLPNKNIFFLGISSSGHRALKYIEYCSSNKSVFNPEIKGAVLSESALDWVRQWYQAQKQVRDHLSEAGVFEGKMVTYLFKENLKATPVTDMDKFLGFSPYSYFDTKMEKAKLYQGLALRAYTFADVRYWFSAQGRGVFDSNYPDMSGFINEQRLAGNKRAELIVFHSDPDDKLNNGLKSQSSTWGLVDKKELVGWMTAISGH